MYWTSTRKEREGQDRNSSLEEQRISILHGKEVVTDVELRYVEFSFGSFVRLMSTNRKSSSERTKQIYGSLCSFFGTAARFIIFISVLIS